MESNITDQQSWSSDSTIAEPHFDEEATLLSARRVVPIKKITVKPGFSRPWIFGFALAGAMLLGVLVTALYYSEYTTTGPQLSPRIETATSGVNGFALDQPRVDATQTTAAIGVASSSVDSDKPASVKAQAPSVSWPTRPDKSANAVSKKSTHRRAVAVDQSSESDYETREERRAARREAKERKRANRERRGGEHSDELLRIREIFEGPQRP